MTDLLDQVQVLEHAADDFGFSWENPQQIMAQILSECEEIQAHLQTDSMQTDTAELQEEIGDLLHAVFSLCVFCQFNPAETLKKTLHKFERRLSLVKELAHKQGLKNLKGHSFCDLMNYWNQAKQLDKKANALYHESGPLPAIQNPHFTLDERLQSSCFYLIDWPLSRVLLKNNASYPWLILVPRRANVREISDLTKEDRHQLMDELHQLTLMMQKMFKPDKINSGALGNIVSQLHLHVVARFQDDPLWPQGIWQASTKEEPYVDADLLISNLIEQLGREDTP